MADKNAMRNVFLILTFFWVSSCGGDRGLNYDGVSNSEHRVFVTSHSYLGYLAAGGSWDGVCNSAADDAGLIRPYKALITSGGVSPRTSVTIHGTIYTVDANGNRTQVATSESNFWTVGLDSAITYDEFGGTVGTSEFVWTGTEKSAATAGNAPSTETCSNWISSGTSAVVGKVGQVDLDWYDDTSNSGLRSCGSSSHIYCISE